MKKSLILSFDLIRPGELSNSLAIASILSYLKKSKEYGSLFTCEHRYLNVYEKPAHELKINIQTFLDSTPIHSFDTIAISAYIPSNQGPFCYL